MGVPFGTDLGAFWERMFPERQCCARSRKERVFSKRRMTSRALQLLGGETASRAPISVPVPVLLAQDAEAESQSPASRLCWLV